MSRKGKRMTKRILITGEYGYVGKMLQKTLQNSYDDYEVSVISVRNNEWKKNNFSKYDAIVHAAALVHSKKQASELYYKVNRDLTADIAKKAKNDGVGQFLFISSMAVYGLDEGVITDKTVPNPKTDYGISKLEAEKILERMRSSKFRVSIVRPPMIYGVGAKGNYKILRKIALALPIIPKIENKRSILYINNFTMELENIIRLSLDGMFYPQNSEYMVTSDLMRVIRAAHFKKTKMSIILGQCVRIAKNIPGPIGEKATKAFGTLRYSEKLLHINDKADVKKEISTKESIEKTEKISI